MKKLLLLLFILFLIPFANAQDIKLNGTISAENNQIKNVANPTDAQDAVTKNYADTQFYTQSEVDAMISSLQSQIDGLNAGNDTGTVTDQDGKSYDYITYGTQIWTVENAEMVTYRDGTPIPQVTDNTEWQNLTTGAWCYYGNDSSKGKLYNWYAVMGIHDAASLTDASLRKAFAPEGWHVPTDAEWTTLENYLITNGYNYDDTTTGNKIGKAMASTTRWNTSTYTGAIGNDQSRNNSSDFNAFPEGYRYNNGSFYDEGSDAIFWSSTENNSNDAWNRDLDNVNRNLLRYNFFNKRDGFSMRFVRD